MKKIIFSLALLFGIFNVNTPTSAQVFNGPGLIGGAIYTSGQLDSNVSKETDVRKLIIAWTNFLLGLAAILAVTAIVWAGFLYITAFGDDGRHDTAKKIIIWAIIGLLIIAAAFAIVNFVMNATL